MFPPMVSASPPPSDDEPSGDEGEELGVADSSFDITGLSHVLGHTSGSDYGCVNDDVSSERRMMFEMYLVLISHRIYPFCMNFHIKMIIIKVGVKGTELKGSIRKSRNYIHLCNVSLL